jgi:hypothetical protein
MRKGSTPTTGQSTGYNGFLNLQNFMYKYNDRATSVEMTSSGGKNDNAIACNINIACVLRVFSVWTIQVRTSKFIEKFMFLGTGKQASIDL